MDGKDKKQQQVEMVAISAIRTEGLQMRAVRSEEATLEYAQKYRDGVELPPGNAVRDVQGVYWLWDGHHRLEGRKLAGLSTMPLVVSEGTREDALWEAVSANKTHGLRRTNRDKRRVVEMALRHPKFMGPPPLSDREVAEHCGVSNNFVSVMHRSLSSDDSQPTRREGKDGRVIDVSNIGKSRQEDALDCSGSDDPANQEEAEDAALRAKEAEWIAQQEAAAQTQEQAPAEVPDAFEPQPDANAEESEPEPAPSQPKRTQHGTPADDRLRDQAGHIVPENLVEVFETRDDFSRLASMLRECQKLVHTIASARGGELYRRRLTCKQKTGQPYKFSCESITTAIRSALGCMPYAAVCPYCKDRVKHDCKICVGMGYVCERHWEEAPADYKEVCTRILQECAAKEAQMRETS